MLSKDRIANPKQFIIDVASEIQSQLLPLPGHAARNAYAHIFGMVKILCNGSYNVADPVKVCSVVEAIKGNPNGSQQDILTEAIRIRKAFLKNEQQPSIDDSL